MAFPTAVNSQITDSVTQSNTKVVAESPALAIGSLYQSLAQSTGLLIENAIAAQRNQNVIAQAAATLGVNQIYSGNARAAAETTEDATATPEALRSRVAQAADAVSASNASEAESGGAIAEIEAAIEHANENVLGRADDVAHALRTSADAVVATVDRVNRVLHQDLMRTIRLAATAATLDAMLREPSKAKEYEAVLRVIERMT